MCLIVFAHHTHPKYPFILLANRDEYYIRPTLEIGFWEEEPDLIGGRDLSAGGTWLAMSRSGAFAAVTNVRASAVQPNAKSRGHLPVDFLKSPQINQSFMRRLQAQAITYNGFNLLTRSRDTLLHFNNQLGIINQIPAGIHGLCNASLNTPWPKLEYLKTRFKSTIDKEFDKEALLNLMMDKQMAEEELLPETGITPEMERALSSIFIDLPTYGTRSTTLITIDNHDVVDMTEITHYPNQKGSQKHFNFKIL
jgi:uncharacterized protein with NRDE domain